MWAPAEYLDVGHPPAKISWRLFLNAWWCNAHEVYEILQRHQSINEWVEQASNFHPDNISNYESVISIFWQKYEKEIYSILTEHWTIYVRRVYETHVYTLSSFVYFRRISIIQCDGSKAKERLKQLNKIFAHQVTQRIMINMKDSYMYNNYTKLFADTPQGISEMLNMRDWEPVLSVLCFHLGWQGY